ncbi:MAG: shikimate dehydrogenase family protein, partial [Candidatus Thorarchaeota archaeon]
NTIYRFDGEVAGCNTDVSGFKESLREQAVSIRGVHATILGAGGAASTVAYSLVKEGASRLDILNRTQSHAETLAKRLTPGGTCEICIATMPTEEFDFGESDLIINCTPIGMSGHSVSESPLRTTSIPSDVVVMDLVYNPRRTLLLQEAEKAGCKTIDGTGMLVHQGATALEKWIGKKPPIEVMRKAVVQVLGG